MSAGLSAALASEQPCYLLWIGHQLHSAHELLAVSEVMFT